MDSIFLTFDLDWASDRVVADMLQILESEKVKATIFVTHATDLLAEMRKNPNIELGIHPNFNPLLEGEGQTDSYKAVVDGLMELIPEAKAVRCHSLVQGSRLLDYFVSCGLTIDSNLFIPMQSGIICRPFVHWNSITRAPYFWEDDVHCLHMRSGISKNWEVTPFLNYSGLKIFDFHPIHVYLNTEDFARYEMAKSDLQDMRKLSAQRFDGTYGTRIFLTDLIRQAKACGLKMKKLGELL